MNHFCDDFTSISEINHHGTLATTRAPFAQNASKTDYHSILAQSLVSTQANRGLFADTFATIGGAA
jgi:hypothetical protein